MLEYKMRSLSALKAKSVILSNLTHTCLGSCESVVPRVPVLDPQFLMVLFLHLPQANIIPARARVPGCRPHIIVDAEIIVIRPPLRN